MSSNEILYASLKPTPELLALLERLQALEPPHLSYSDILERAQRYLLSVKDEIDLKTVSAKHFNYIFNGTVPLSLKIRILDADLYKAVGDLIAEQFGITRVVTPFRLRIVLTAYLMHLEGSAEATPAAVQPAPSDDVNLLKLELLSSIIKTNNKDKLIEIREILKGE